MQQGGTDVHLGQKESSKAEQQSVKPEREDR
ncbi:hypothetical protein GCK32_021724 [Trichostrongylus colubriformis]|uniref:Uncharacterized protein n=1 Tax=Trichostrongylus colubriformis TaxID=6319 RepID=A0AAN8FRZ1_TRICO